MIDSICKPKLFHFRTFTTVILGIRNFLIFTVKPLDRLQAGLTKAQLTFYELRHKNITIRYTYQYPILGMSDKNLETDQL